MTAPTATPQAAPIDAKTASLLALMDGDPIHAADRAVILAAIVQTGRDNAGIVDPNSLRVLLTDEHGSIVYPAVIGAVIASLRHRGVLREAGWVITTGSKSGNSGRPARRYALHLPMTPADKFPCANTGRRSQGSGVRVEGSPTPPPRRPIAP